MTSSHLFYIPMVLLVGAIAGFVFGKKAALAELEDQRRREERRAGRGRADV